MPGARVPAAVLLNAHHLQWVIRGGRHLVKNLIFLCFWHHRQHHEGKLLISVSGKGEVTFAAKEGWVLGDDGQLTADKAWWRGRLWAEGASETEIAEAKAILAGDLVNAYVETPKDDRGWVFGPGKGWEVREGRVEYGERSRGIVLFGGPRRSRGIAPGVRRSRSSREIGERRFPRIAEFRLRNDPAGSSRRLLAISGYSET